MESLFAEVGDRRNGNVEEVGAQGYILISTGIIFLCRLG